eukprot:8828422-Pyramimonas_sp.AAC.1
MQIARVCYTAYRACRCMAMNGRVDGPRFAWRRLIAGCGFATMLIRVFTLAALDGLNHPRS